MKAFNDKYAEDLETSMDKELTELQVKLLLAPNEAVKAVYEKSIEKLEQKIKENENKRQRQA